MTNAQYKKLLTIFDKANILAAELILSEEKYDMRQITDRIFNMIKRHEDRQP